MLKLTKRTALAAALIGIVGCNAQAEEASQNSSLDRFKARVAAIEEQYPEAKKAVVPELGKNVTTSDAKVKKVEENDMASVPEAKIPEIEKVVNLGISSMRAVASKDGTILYIADAGRFVFMGRMLDVWQQKELKTIDEIERATQRVFLDTMGYDKTTYAGYKLGHGPKRTVLFVDPHCGWCHKLISEVKSDPELLKDYTFTFHVVPVLGEASHTYAKKLWCSVGTDEEKMQAMLEGDEAMNALPAMTTCPMDDQDHTVMLSKIIGVRGVPFVIAPDGRVSQGKPSDIKSFLRGEEPKQAKAAAKPQK